MNISDYLIVNRYVSYFLYNNHLILLVIHYNKVEYQSASNEVA